MGKNIKLDKLSDAIAEELTLYHSDINEKIDKLSAKAAKELVTLTRATAPVGERGSFKRNITSKQITKSKNGSKYAWCVKPPDHRLTHLLVHGHATKDGGRTKADPFLENALDTVLPMYEESVKEAIKNG